MTLGEALGIEMRFAQAVILGGAVALAGTLLVTPRIMPKLRGAGIVGRDIHKPGRPEVPEMGGIGVFLAFYTGVFAILLAHPPPDSLQLVILVALITAAGAAMTGVIDDLVELRQRFKAFIPIVFAAPLAVYVTNYTIGLPFFGAVDFGLLYPIVLVPLAIACAANGFNMLEGYNGMGAGVGLVMTVATSALVVLNGKPEALILLAPLGGALGGFLWFNRYPARIFPGDTLTLLIGGVIATAAMIGKVEFWAALLFLPHVAEFFLKARGRFAAENFAQGIEPRGDAPPLLRYSGPTESLTHILLKRGGMTEPKMAFAFWVLEAVLAGVVVVAYLAARQTA